MQSHKSNQNPECEIPSGNSALIFEPIYTNYIDIDVHIAIRIWVRSCTQHPIEKFVS